MFDPNQMAELAAIKAYRYARDGGGGAHKVYNTSKAYYDSRGHEELPKWQKLATETMIRWRQQCQILKEHYRVACLTSQEGFYYGDDIPF
jgi:hypothetical protein